MPPDGGGKGHFTSMADMSAAIIDHERRLRTLEADVHVLSDMTVGKKKRPRRRRIRPKAGE